MAKRIAVASADFTFINHGSLWLVIPAGTAQRAHLAAHVSDEAQWLGGALAVEPRYVDGLASALTDDGFHVIGVGHAHTS
jgi:hypothetical protein